MKRRPVWKRTNRKTTTVVLAILLVMLIVILWVQLDWLSMHPLRVVISLATNLDLFLIVLDIVLTVSLAGIGIEMANNPPTTTTAKWCYRAVFSIIGGLLVWVTCSQEVRSITEQTSIRTAAETERRTIQTQYDQVTGKLNSIQEFVEHPPAGLTKDQVAEVVRSQVADAVRMAVAGKPQLPPVATNTTPVNPAVPTTPAASNLPQSPDSQTLQREAFGFVQQVNDWIASATKDAPNPSALRDQTDQAAVAAERERAQTWMVQQNAYWAKTFQEQAQDFVKKLQIRGLRIACISGPYFDDPSRMLMNRKICADYIDAAARKLK
jgi:hypothetical protein